TPTILKSQEIQLNLQDKPTTQLNLQDKLTKKRKRQTTVKEKNILDSICEGDSMPTDNKINNILTELNTISSN
ncbi:10100_t:CDS:1, partial [Diversispora eburnea]